MSVQQAKQSAGANPRTLEEARAFVKQVESLFMPWNVEGIVAGFTDDCVVRFGDLPEFRGANGRTAAPGRRCRGAASRSG
jgi:hypothetical protein